MPQPPDFRQTRARSSRSLRRTFWESHAVVSPHLWHTWGMDDLQGPPGPGAPRGLTIPASELTERFSHSSGPGGQGVNTSDSRVQLSLDISTTTALNEVQRARVLERLSSRLSSGILTVTSAEQRSQHRNRAAARQRLAELLREAITPPIPRRATKPTRASQRRRLEAKKHRSSIKRDRRKPGTE